MRRAGAAALLGQVLAATVIGVLPIYLLGSLSVFIDVGRPLTAGRLGEVSAVFWAASAVSSWPAGLLAERVGALRGLALGMAVTALAAVVAADAHTLGTLALAMACAGAGNALVVPACNLALAGGLPRDRQGTAFGLKQAAISSGVLAAGLAVPAAAAVGGWREAFLAAAVLAVLCAGAAAYRAGARPRPGVGSGGGRGQGDRGDAGSAAGHGRNAGAGRAGHGGGVGLGVGLGAGAGHGDGDRSRGPRPAPEPAPALAPVRTPVSGLLVLAVAAGMASATNTTLTAFFVSSAVRNGRDPRTAGLLLGTGALLGIAGRLVMGRKADRREGNGLADIRLMLLLGAPGFALLAFPSFAPALLAGTVLAFGAGWGWTGLYHLAVVRLRPHAPAAATGATQTGLFLGGLAGPWIFGAVATASYAIAWLAAGGWLLLAAFGVHTAIRLMPDGDALLEG